MYCKKCGKEYKKDKKICKECGLALTPGKSPGKDGNNNKKFIITGVAVLVVIVAVFLIVGLGGMLPNQLEGVWYDQAVSSNTIEFKPGGVVNLSYIGIASTGSYSYNGATGEGNINKGIDNGAHPFTCDGTTLVMDGATYTRK